MNEQILAQNIDTWLDTQGDMKDNTLQAMTEGIEACDLIIIFVTRAYIDKCKKKTNDNCKLEFEHAYHQKGVERLIAVVMEPDCANPSKWGGPVGAILASQLYIGCAEDTDASCCVCE